MTAIFSSQLVSGSASPILCQLALELLSQHIQQLNPSISAFVEEALQQPFIGRMDMVTQAEGEDGGVNAEDLHTAAQH